MRRCRYTCPKVPRAGVLKSAGVEWAYREFRVHKVFSGTPLFSSGTHFKQLIEQT